MTCGRRTCPVLQARRRKGRGTDAALPVGSWGCGPRAGGRAGGCGPDRGIDSGSTGSVSGDRLGHKFRQRHSVDDRYEDQNQEPRRHHGRFGPFRRGGHTGRLIAVGIVSWLAFQAFQNIGMNIGLMPVTGLPLPFVSYGGSSMFAQGLAIGLLFAVRRRSYATT